jgi:hypothetical protein
MESQARTGKAAMCRRQRHKGDHSQNWQFSASKCHLGCTAGMSTPQVARQWASFPIVCFDRVMQAILEQS